MDNAKKQLVDKLKSANNVLVTVSRNPSVDQLSALLGLTLLLNKQGKHTAAVFSGEIPSTLEFLKPDETIERTTDSLRDFIIALDKSKADKLRYKVEDNVVRIFITPYKTSISQDDLEFSQGDFNVDVVVALGVKQQEDLDGAITAHGRILHDATVASINISAEGGLGSINWQDPHASSLSELVTELAQALGDDLFDNQIATALLTGIVAETNRFSNDKTSALTMSASAALMAAGANQQLVASKLEEGDGGTINSGNSGDSTVPKADNGTLDIAHDEANKDAPKDESPAAILPAPNFDEPGHNESDEHPQMTGLSDGSKLITEPPTLGGTLTANTRSDGLDPVTDPLSLPSAEAPQILTRNTGSASNQLAPLLPEQAAPPAGQSAPASTFGPRPAAPVIPSDTPSGPPPPVSQPEPSATPPEPVTPVPTPTPAPTQSFTPPPSDWSMSPTPPAPTPDPLTLASETASAPIAAPSGPTITDAQNHTLAELEESVRSPHAGSPEEITAARDEVNKALSSSAAPAPAPAPIAALNAQPLSGSLHTDTPAPAPSESGLPSVAVSPDGTLLTHPLPPATPASDTQVTDSTAPPPVPPPLMPYTPPQNQQ